MQAVRLYRYGGPEVLVFEEHVPDPPMNGDAVMIETVAASVNPIDWKVRSGARQKDFPLLLPAILGRDVSGVVSAVGANVRHVKPGDRVLAMGDATYAEKVVIGGSLVTHAPDGLDLADAAAIPLISLTGDQLVRHATAVTKGQTLVVSGAIGSVGRAAVHTALKLGVRVIAAVRARQVDAARQLNVPEVLAIDDDAAIAGLPPLDAVADTVGGEAAVKLLAKVKPGGSFGFASVLPAGAADAHPSVKVTRVFARPDPSKVREFADDVRDGKFALPIGHRLPLRDAAHAHVLGERGGVGKIILLVRPAGG
jgi:NADPH:quinone reductase-like Zn-dependent oxidoreductase